jgi:hypothetical protein
VRQVGLAEDTLVLAAGLRDLAERRAPDLGLLSALRPWQVRLRRRDDRGRAKDAPGLLELRRVRELLLTVLADEDLDPVLVATAAERRRRLARDVLAPEEELGEGPLRTQEGVLVPQGAHELLTGRLIHLAVLE